MKLIEFAVVLFFTMFIYSGSKKITNFKKKVEILSTKTGLPHFINIIGMLGVIGLELFGSLLIIIHVFNRNVVDYDLIEFVFLLYFLFLIVVTFLYHPPWEQTIPFLSNVTTFSGLIFLYILLKK